MIADMMNDDNDGDENDETKNRGKLHSTKIVETKTPPH
jgi:hypothetical protein